MYNKKERSNKPRINRCFMLNKAAQMFGEVSITTVKRENYGV